MLDPEASAVLDELGRRAAAQPEPTNADEKLRQARAMTAFLATFSGAPPAGVETKDVEVPGPRGKIPVRLYRPGGGGPGDGPLLVWFHGGGAMAGSLDTNDVPLRQLAARTGWAVASVDYRMGPEHPYPASHEDCDAAVRWLAKNAPEGVAAGRLAVGGDSIGGLFAATVARLARERGGPALCGQVMLYPNTDLRPDRDHPSLSSENGNVMTRESMAYENDLYIPDVADRQTPLASPLLATDLAGLPPAFLATCEHDPLRDEGEAYGRRLAEAGVAVDHRRYDGMIHAFFQMAGRLDRAFAVMDDVAAFLTARS